MYFVLWCSLYVLVTFSEKPQAEEVLPLPVSSFPPPLSQPLTIPPSSPFQRALLPSPSHILTTRSSSFHLMSPNPPPQQTSRPFTPPPRLPSPQHTEKRTRARARAWGKSLSPGRPEVEVARLGPIPLRQCHELEEHRHPLQLPEAPLQRRARRRPEAHHRLDGHRGRGWATTSGGTWPRTWWRIKWRTKWVECC